MESKTIEQNMKKPLGGGYPFVSVMVLSYNYGHLLGKALEACAAQTFRDLEVVMIDNGSTDSTKQVYIDFCEKHPDIRTEYVFVTPNQGPANGWHEGLKRAHGEYVMFNDADDWMDPDCLEKLAALAKETGSDRVTGQYREVLADGRVGRVRVLSHKEHRVQMPMLQGVLLRRSVIVENDLHMPDIVSYDFWLIFKFARCEKHRGVFLYETVYNYYFNPNSMCAKITDWGEEKLYNDFFKLSVLYTAQILEGIEEKMLRDEIMYEVTRIHYYSLLLQVQVYLSRDEAMRFYRRSHELMQKKMPDYWKNPLIWRLFRGGYKLSVTVMMMAMTVIDRLHLSFLLPLAGKYYKCQSSAR